MKIVEEKTTDYNGNIYTYAITDSGNAYVKSCKLKDSEETDDYTNPELWTVLDRCINQQNRVRIWYGFTDCGRAWLEEYDVTGRIGRSGGTIKIPLMIFSSRSFGGPALLDHCIVRIDDIAEKKTLYQHKNFHTGDFEVKKNEAEKYPYEVWNTEDNGDVKNVANFMKEAQAVRYVQFMKGERYNK